MKYYSELTKKVYNTTEELEAQKAAEEAKKAAEEAKEKRKALVAEKQVRAKEVEDAYKAIIDATKKYEDLKRKFIRDYGHFWMNYKDGDMEVSTFEFFNNFFNDIFNRQVTLINATYFYSYEILIENVIEKKMEGYCENQC